MSLRDIARREHSFDVCLDPDLIAERDRLLAAADEAEGTMAGPALADTSDVDARIREASYTVWYRIPGDEEYGKVLTKFDRTGEVGALKFGRALRELCITRAEHNGTPMDIAEAIELMPYGLGTKLAKLIVDGAIALPEVPFSLAGSVQTGTPA